MNKIEDATDWYTQGIETGWIRLYEREWIRFLESEYGTLSETEKLCIVFLSRFFYAGHVILPLDMSPAEWFKITEPDQSVPENLPDKKVSIDDLTQSKLVGQNGELKPLYLEGNNLSIRKYRVYEKKLVNWIQSKCEQESAIHDPEKVITQLDQLFEPSGKDTGTNWQKTAAVLSLIKPFLIISGGPGTGKTTTVAKILALQNRISGKPLSVALAAPTGKAAGRMGEALNRELKNLNLTESEIVKIPKEAKTLHRLLNKYKTEGLLPPAVKKVLHHDLLIIDEASMVDLSLMHRLIMAMGDNTSLILLGDKDQLSSVEAGSVFADLCTKQENEFSPETANQLSELGIDVPINEQSAVMDSIVYLTKSYRFDEKSGIGSLAELIKTNTHPEHNAESIFSKFDDIDHNSFNYRKEDFSELTNHLIARINLASEIMDPEKLIAFWKESIWLAVLRRGLTGTERLNRLIESIIVSNRKYRAESGWYHGRPVMISKNDYNLGVFNGDLSVCLRDENGNLRVHVETGSDIKSFKPNRIMHYDPAFFITVHKSQGSEFESVNLLLPAEDTPILTKELLYTAVTRARKKFTIYGNLDLFKIAMQRKTIRYTGLRIA